MRIIAHRGLWKEVSDQNSMPAFQAAAKAGYGIELDIRDFQGEIIIHHDVPKALSSPLPLRSFLEYWANAKLRVPLLLDIKASGLGPTLVLLMREFPAIEYYTFDLAMPELFQYHHLGLPILSRWSDLEPKPAMDAALSGLCIDAFRSEWYSTELLEEAAARGGFILLISPELHGRDHIPLWRQLKTLSPQARSSLALCTDFPEEAMRFLNPDGR